MTLKEGRFPAGTYVVRLDQPYRDYAVDLLAAQNYPKDGGEAYDDISWELPAHYHLSVVPTADAQVRSANLTLLSEAPQPRAQVAGEGPVYLLKDTGQEGLLEARYRLARFQVAIAERAFSAGGSEYPAGSWILTAQAGLGAAVRELAAKQALEFASVAAAPNVTSHAAPVPRLGLWVPWADTDTIGWARYTLDQRHIPYIYVRDEDIRAGKLRDKYDVLLYGHVDLELAEQIQGIPKAWGPMPFKKTAATPSFGTPAESDDITGGIGYGGLAELQKFVEAGGLMITLGSGSMLALEGGIVRGVRREAGGVPRSTQGGGAAAAAASQSAATRTPGAHVRVSFARPDHPIAYGYPARTYVFRQNFPLYSTPRHWLRMAYCTTCLDGPLDPSGVVLEWGDREGAPLVVSGQAWGEDNLDRAPCDSGPALRSWTRGRVQLQSAAPRSQSRRSAHAVERDHQLARDRGRSLRGSRALGARQRCAEVAAELLDEVDRHACVHAALAVEKPRLVDERYHRPVPDIRVQIQATRAVAVESHEALRRDVIPRQGERHDETAAVERVEQLPAVGVIVGTPNERPLALATGRAGRGFLWPVAPAEQVAVTDRVVARVQRLAFPAELEQSLGHAALVAGVLIDRAPPLRGPADDFDGEVLGILDQTSVAGEAVGGGQHQLRVMDAPHAGRGHVGDVLQVDIHTIL